jgi:nucleotide-binding universal stress UspA family protein
VVDNYFPMVDATGDVNYIDITDKLREHGKSILSKAKETATLAGVKVNAKIIDSTSGQIHKSILNAVKKCHADLIVMGTHGLRGIERLVMGSDAETVARTSPVPVLLVRTAPNYKYP